MSSRAVRSHRVARWLGVGLTLAVLGGCAATPVAVSTPRAGPIRGVPTLPPTIGSVESSAEPSPTPAGTARATPEATPKPAPIAGTWRVRRVLSPAHRTALIPDSAYEDEAYVVRADCPEEPCTQIEVTSTPLGVTTPAVLTVLERDGARYVSAMSEARVVACVNDEDGRVPGGASMTSSLRLWVAAVREAGSAVERDQLVGRVDIVLEPTPIGVAAGCEPQTASFDLAGRREAVALRRHRDDSTLGVAGTMRMPRIAVRVAGASVDYFAISGDTAEELLTSLARGGETACGVIPYEWHEGDQRPSACVITRFDDWDRAISEGTDADGRCTIERSAARARYVVQFPRWAAPRNVPVPLVEWWRQVVETIRDHESGHVRIGRDHVTSLNEELTGADCDDAESILRRWTKTLNLAHEAYDRSDYAKPWPAPPAGL